MPEQTPEAPIPADGAAAPVSEAPLPAGDAAAAETPDPASLPDTPAGGSVAPVPETPAAPTTEGTVDATGTGEADPASGTADGVSPVPGAEGLPTAESLPGADGMTPGLEGTLSPDAAALPLDPMAQALELLNAGGPVMYLLAGLSIVAAALILAKLLQFATARLGSRRTTQQALALCRGGQDAEALEVLSRDRSPVAQVMAIAVRGRCDPRLTEATAREEAERLAGLYLDRLSSGLRTLAAIATLSPLLGLLGTVLGMINAFQALESAGSKVDPSILSGGIWVALLTTAAGLVVAIPAAAAHQWMEGTVDKVSRAMEDAATRIFTLHLPAAPTAVATRVMDESPFGRLTPRAQGAE